MKRSQVEKTPQEEKQPVGLERNSASQSFENLHTVAEGHEAAVGGTRRHAHHLAMSTQEQRVINLVLSSAALTWLEVSREGSLDAKAEKVRYGISSTQVRTEAQPENAKLEGAVLTLQQEEAGRVSYQLDRQKRMSQTALRDTKVRKETEALLNCVAQGKQDSAEAFLEKSPGLALAKGTVTDLSKRTFKDITAFQYAVWALDWHMWTMLLKYLPSDAAAQQLQELESKGTVHGVHFSLDRLISALDTHVKNYPSWNVVQLHAHWQRQVGSAQLQLPAHVINEYCHPTRPFLPCPDFSADTALPRSMETDEGHWFTTTYNGGAFGFKLGVLRSDLPDAWEWSGGSGGGVVTSCIMEDRDALQSLLKTRQQQLLSLKQTLTGKSAFEMGKEK